MAATQVQVDGNLDARPSLPYSKPALSAAEKVNSPAESASPWLYAILLFVLCFVLHVLLVVACAVLVILRYTLSQGTITLSNHGFFSGSIFYYLTASPNTAVKIYLVLTLYVTQKLAFRRNVRVEQTLTSMHDKSSAWLGLGASVPVLWRYFTALVRKKEDRASRRSGSELPAFIGVLLIAIYFCCGLSLGVIAPDLVFVGGTINGSPSFQNLTSKLQGITSNAVQEAFPIVGMLPLVTYYEDVVTVGLQDTLIYDVPTIFVWDQSIPVTGTAFGVNCGQIPGASQVQSSNGSLIVHVEEQLQDVVINPASERTLNVRPALWRNTSNKSPPPATLIVASTFPIQDSNNNADAASVDLNTQIVPVKCSFDCSSVSAVQVVACNVFSKDFGHGHQDYNAVSLETNEWPFWADIPTTTPLSQVWSNWSLPGPPIEEQSALNLIGNFSHQSPSSHKTLFSTINGSTVTEYTLSILEDNIMEALGYYDPDIANVTLSDLEDILGQAIASVFWRAALRRMKQDPLGTEDINIPLDTTVRISHWSPILGLSVSIVMLAVAITLTWQPKPNSKDETHPQVDSFGVLQLTWYLGQKGNSLSRNLVEAVNDPTLDRLRDWGKHVRHRFADDD